MTGTNTSLKMKLVQVMAIKTFSFYCRSVHVQENFSKQKDKIYKSFEKKKVYYREDDEKDVNLTMTSR